MPRSSMFTPELAASICERLAAGESLRAICRDDGMPTQTTVFRWLEADENFRGQYARAKERGCDVLADEILEIADTPEVGRKVKIDDEGKEEVTEGDMIEHRRLRVDARKWYLSKLAPKKYGERMNLEHSGAIEIGDRLQRAIEADKSEP